MEILALRDLSFTYALQDRPTLRGVEFSVREGDFTLLCGPTGSGKSTLLRLLKRELTPQGERRGGIFFRGEALEKLDGRRAAAAIGYVSQRPEQQLVTDKVWHELAFGLENLGVESDAIRRRVSEMAAYFGMEDWFDKRVDELSGGQKQLLNLAAVLAMQPELLILDEPTAQLDPIAAADFLETVSRLNRDMGLTVLLAEHRLEEAMPRCDRLLVLSEGRLCFQGRPEEVCGRPDAAPVLRAALPAAARLYEAMPAGETCPLTVREGRDWLAEHFRPKKAAEEAKAAPPGEPALEMKEIWFRYGREEPDVLRGTELTVRRGEIFCLLGGNGSGKTTALSVAAGLLKPYHGDVRLFGRRLADYGGALYSGCVARLPQDVQTVFLEPTVERELQDAGEGVKALPYDLTPLYGRHPYDLSGGEQQLVALAKVLSARPRLLLLDEPTKGLDAGARDLFVSVLRELQKQGVTILAVTHDVDFAAACADRCALFFRGETVGCAPPREFFAQNHFYTTAVNRMTRQWRTGLLTVEDVLRCAERREGEVCSS